MPSMKSGAMAGLILAAKSLQTFSHFIWWRHTSRNVCHHWTGICSFVFFLMVMMTPLWGEVRKSSSYQVTSESVDSGGQQVATPIYKNSGTSGGIAGLAEGRDPVKTAKSGYFGQVHHVVTLQLGPEFDVVEENFSWVPSSAFLLDDGSFTRLAPSDLNWEIISGPLQWVPVNGRMAAGSVFEDTSARVQVSYAGIVTWLDLIVIDRFPDNFNGYASDGLPDDWQVRFFGLDNPLAAPHRDPDGDGQNNFFEFKAGLNPTDQRSRFTIGLSPISGPVDAIEVRLHPIFQDRNYTVLVSDNLVNDSWKPLVDSTFHDEDGTRILTDDGASAGRRFYKVKIEDP